MLPNQTKPILSAERPHAGFTLIELLIVVAIIAILAAIAVPNFLEAQTRAKVSRAKTDLRSIATALEAFGIDHNEYPPNPSSQIEFYGTPHALTTPVSYLSTLIEDPFKSGLDLSGINPWVPNPPPLYDYYRIIDEETWLERIDAGDSIFALAIDANGAFASLIGNRGAFVKYGRWLQWSIGPDGVFWHADDDFNNPAIPSSGLKDPSLNPIHAPWGYSFDVPYDPTNGTVSFGNIIRSQKTPEGALPFMP